MVARKTPSALAPVNFIEERVARQAARQVCRVQGRVKGRAADPGVPQDPLAPRRGPLGSSPDRGGAVGNAPALVPGPLTRLQELQLLTELSPQVKGRAKLGMNWHSTVALCTYHMLVYRSMS